MNGRPTPGRGAHRSLFPLTLGRRYAPERPLPAWPVLVFLWGYPVFWLAGLMYFSLVIMAVPMLAFLLLRRRVLLVPGTLPWMGYALWMLPSMLMIDTTGRLIATGVQFSQYLALAIAIVYVINARETLPASRILNGLTFIWVFIIAGGYLGMLFPEAQLTWTIGRLLPASLASNDYVSEIVYPVFAQIQFPSGAEEAFVRPSAPFIYTNAWGSAMAILTPIVIGNTLARPSVGRVVAFVLTALAAIPVAVATSNRGLFVGLGLGLVTMAVRLALRRQWRATLGLTAVSALAIAAALGSGLLEGITARQEVSDTTQGRSSLYWETFERTLASPILGYGAPRPSLFSEINVGTQGAVWNAMFSFGFIGLAWFIAALLSGVIRTADAPSIPLRWLHTSVVVTLALTWFYGVDRPIVYMGLALALLLRQKYTGPEGPWSACEIPAHATSHAR